MTPHERRFDPKSIDKLESPARGKFFPVDTILEYAEVRGGLNVADIGAGSGYFAVPIARRVFPGKVFAIEPAYELQEVIRRKLTASGAPDNVRVLEGEDSATGLENASCDLIFLSAVWHEIDDHEAALREFSRIAAANATLVIVDWSPDATCPPGPPLGHRIARTTVEASLKRAGWRVVKSGVITDSTYAVVSQQ